MNNTTQNEDCYFYIDGSVPEEEQVISCRCVECEKKNQSSGWFWQGSKTGYGKNNVTCKMCGHQISAIPKGNI